MMMMMMTMNNDMMDEYGDPLDSHLIQAIITLWFSVNITFL
jgi:hypothetical protein